MRRIKGLVTALAFAGICSTYPAQGATKSCQLLTDSGGDVTTINGLAYDDPNVDIMSADVAAGPKLVTAVIRMAKLEAWDKASGPLGNRSYLLRFKVGSETTLRFMQMTGFGVLDSISPQNTYVFGHVGPTGELITDGNGSGSFDLSVGTVSISAPIDGWSKAKLAPVVKRKTITQLYAESFVHFANGDSYGIGPVNTVTLNPARPTDTATSTGRYVVGLPTCVPVN